MRSGRLSISRGNPGPAIAVSCAIGCCEDNQRIEEEQEAARTTTGERGRRRKGVRLTDRVRDRELHFGLWL
jgi:hypothetical protein